MVPNSGSLHEGPSYKEDLIREWERSRLVAGFLESQFFRCRAPLEPDRTVAAFLVSACRLLFQGVGSHLSKQLLVNKGGLHGWMAGDHLVSFGQVVDIAQSLNCSVEAVLTGDVSRLPIILPEYTKRSSKNFYVIRNVKGKKFERDLHRIIRKAKKEFGPFVPISLSEIARRMEVDQKLYLAFILKFHAP